MTRGLLPPTSPRFPLVTTELLPAELLPRRAFSDLIRLAVAPPTAAGPRLFSDVFRLVPSSSKHLGGEGRAREEGEKEEEKKKRTFPPRCYPQYQQEETKFADSRLLSSPGAENIQHTNSSVEGVVI